MKVSDYLATFLKSKVDHCFGLQGGAVVHLFDSCERIGPKPVYCHHEQAAGFAATSYARIRGYGVCIVTTGPGATNSLTPLLGAYQDSIPVLFISGQTRAEHVSYGTSHRQVGTQEAPIVNIVRPITKWADWCRKPSDVRPMLEEAYSVSISNRKGPVWLDIPVDVSWSEM
jgi:acetolactate synthase-1/2/3 large subunit